MYGTLSINSLPYIKAVIFTGYATYPGYGAASLFGIKMLYPLSNTPIVGPVTGALAAIAPNGDAAPLFIEETTSSVEELEIYQKDGRAYFGATRNKTAYEIMKMVKIVKQEMKNIKVPMMILHGSIDMICLSKGSVELHEKSATLAHEKSLHIIPDCKHEVLMETTDIQEKYTNIMIDYYESFITKNNEENVNTTIANETTNLKNDDIDIIINNDDIDIDIAIENEETAVLIEPTKIQPVVE